MSHHPYVLAIVIAVSTVVVFSFIVLGTLALLAPNAPEDIL